MVKVIKAGNINVLRATKIDGIRVDQGGKVRSWTTTPRRRSLIGLLARHDDVTLRADLGFDL